MWPRTSVVGKLKFVRGRFDLPAEVKDRSFSGFAGAADFAAQHFDSPLLTDGAHPEAFVYPMTTQLIHLLVLGLMAQKVTIGRL